MKRLIALGLTGLLLAACAGAPPQPGRQADESVAAGEIQPAADRTEGEMGARAAKPATQPTVAATLLTPALQKGAQKFVRRAFDLLYAGEVDKARADLEHAEALDPENKTLGCLLRGMRADLAPPKIRVAFGGNAKNALPPGITLRPD